LQRWLEEAGFKKAEISVVAREDQPPHFETILASAQKQGGAGERGAGEREAGERGA
jgi:hypothetical protein